MKQHTMICTKDEVGQVIDNLNESGAEWVRAKQIDTMRYLVTWETEDEKDDKGE